MNRVLSFPQSQSCDNPSEVVSKRFCFSCIFSVSFISVILGYLLGSRQTSAHIGSCASLNQIRTTSEPNIRYDDIFRNLKSSKKDSNVLNPNLTYTNYEEAALLKQHFEKYKFDYVSPIIIANLLLTFKNKDSPDALEIKVDDGFTYRNERNATYTYGIPDDAILINKITNNVSGLPVYGNYGTQDEFDYLTKKNISLQGCIVLLRLGKISILEKVTEAFKRGVNGVLLFADPQQYPNVNMLTVTEEISPTLLANLQKIYNSLGSRQQDLYNGVPVQIIEAMTAQNILREMAVGNKSPESWRGSLNALYSLGPGFSVQDGRLFLYSYFINMNYTFYDVAAYLKGSFEHDRYIILGNIRRSLNNGEKKIESSNILMEVSRTLAELKMNEGWIPKRTIVFCSFGLEEGQIYSEDSWIQKNKHIIKRRTVAYFDIKQPMNDLEYLNVKSNPLLVNSFERISALIENPNAEEKRGEKKSLFDVWRLQQKYIYRDYRQQILDSENNLTSPQTHLMTENFSFEIANTWFDLFEIPSLSAGYTNEKKNHVSNDSTYDMVNIFEYENAIVQLWTLLTFSYSNNLLIPFNITTYTSILNNFHKKIYLENEKHLQNINMTDSFINFGKSLKNLTTNITTFQNNMRMFDDYKLLELRILNDNLMQIYRLLRCDEFNHDDKLSSLMENQYPVFLSLQETLKKLPLNNPNLKLALKKSHNCVDEINFLLNEFNS